LTLGLHYTSDDIFEKYYGNGKVAKGIISMQHNVYIKKKEKKWKSCKWKNK
jgi:hypothetical protein